MRYNKFDPNFIQIKENLLNWYSTHQRDLPWRKHASPYSVWVSEIMLQQTQVLTVIDYYTSFIARFPSVEALAEASSDEVLTYWRGLGYYSRALNLHFAAKQIVSELSGRFPNSSSEILKLKGIGKYTAAAIASICFDEAVLAIDSNLFRVLSRFYACDYDISKSNAFDYFSEKAKMFLIDEKTGDINQAFMDLGSSICSPKNPNCTQCPLNSGCLAYKNDSQNEFPNKSKKTNLKDLNLNYFLIFHKKQFLVKQRSTDFYWKKLYELCTETFGYTPCYTEIVPHRLSHIRMKLHFSSIEISNEKEFLDLAIDCNYQVLKWERFYDKTFPKPITAFITNHFS